MAQRNNHSRLRLSHYKIHQVKLGVMNWILLCTAYYVTGDYALEVRMHSYSNPSNACASCHNGISEGCCDEHSVFTCNGNQKCDTYFYFCLQEYENEQFECNGGQLSKSAFQNGNSKNVDFSQEEILGLPNPVSLRLTSKGWNATQLYIQIMDYDGLNEEPISTSNLNDDTIDYFLIDIPDDFFDTIRDEIYTLPGAYDIATIEVSFGLICATNYYGPECLIFCEAGDTNCICREEFTSELCQDTNDHCAGITCSKNGQCEDGVNSFTCVCDSGFTGQLCETNIDDCAGIDCSGNGQCEDDIDSFTCVCNTDFTGQLCEINTKDINCTLIDCSSENGEAKCEDNMNAIACVCNSGFTGQLCETNIDDCAEVDCNGNGQCEDGIDSFTCVCDSGFTGQLCEINIDDCAGVDCSENGQCEDGVNSFTCICDSGFTGSLCHYIIEGNNTSNTGLTASTKDPLTTSNSWISGGLFGGIALICLIVAVIVYISFRLKQNRMNVNKYDDHSINIDTQDNTAYTTNQSSLRANIGRLSIWNPNTVPSLPITQSLNEAHQLVDDNIARRSSDRRYSVVPVENHSDSQAWNSPTQSFATYDNYNTSEYDNDGMELSTFLSRKKNSDTTAANQAASLTSEVPTYDNYCDDEYIYSTIEESVQSHDINNNNHRVHFTAKTCDDSLRENQDKSTNGTTLGAPQETLLHE